MEKEQITSLRNSLRKVGNGLSLEGNSVSALIILKLASFADDEALTRLVKEIKGIVG